MKPLAYLVVCASLVAPSGPHRSEAFRFQPAAGSALDKHFMTKGDLRLVGLELEYDGTVCDPAMFGLDGEALFRFGYELASRDEYKEIVPGRPTELLRTFAGLGFWVESDEGYETRRTGDGLIGKTIRYVWDERAKTYRRSYVGDKGTPTQLAEMDEDLDLRALLPANEVEEGETWVVEGETLASVLVPGLDFERALEDEHDFLGTIPDELAAALREALRSARATCRYEGYEEGGSEHGIIGFEGQVRADVALDPELFFRDRSSEDIEVSSLMAGIKSDLSGRCRWNLSEGRFESFEMEGAGEIILEFDLDVIPLGIELTGRATFAIDFARDARAETHD